VKILKLLLNRMQMSHFTVVRINASGFLFKGHRLMILEYLNEEKDPFIKKSYLHFRFPFKRDEFSLCAELIPSTRDYRLEENWKRKNRFKVTTRRLF